MRHFLLKNPLVWGTTSSFPLGNLYTNIFSFDIKSSINYRNSTFLQNIKFLLVANEKYNSGSCTVLNVDCWKFLRPEKSSRIVQLNRSEMSSLFFPQEWSKISQGGAEAYLIEIFMREQGSDKTLPNRCM